MLPFLLVSVLDIYRVAQNKIPRQTIWQYIRNQWSDFKYP